MGQANEIHTENSTQLRTWEKPAIKRIGMSEAETSGSYYTIDGSTGYYGYSYTFGS